MAIIMPSLCRDIDRGLSPIVEQPDYHLKRYRQGYGSPHLEQHIHSWLIEHPDVRKRLEDKTQNEKRAELRTLSRKGAKKLQEAWRYLKGEQFTSNTTHNSFIVLETARIVNDDPNLGFRPFNVSLLMEKFTPPSYKALHRRLDEIFNEFQNPEFHPVEQAIYTHLYLAGIQPTEDGNKRTARLIQNKLLYDASIPTAHIPIGERDIYIRLLEKGLAGTKLAGETTDDYHAMKPLFEYIGGKILNGVDELTETAKKIKET